MAQQTVTLVSAEKKTGTNKKGNWFFYIFKDAGGNTWQTAFNSGLGSQLAGALDQSVTLTYHEETRGDFTNSVIDHADFGATEPWKDVTGGLSPDVPTSVNAPAAATSSKDESIARAVAFKGAIDLASSGVLDADKDGIIAVAEFFEGYLLTGKVAETVRY